MMSEDSIRNKIRERKQLIIKYTTDKAKVSKRLRQFMESEIVRFGHEIHILEHVLNGE